MHPNLPNLPQTKNHPSSYEPDLSTNNYPTMCVGLQTKNPTNVGLDSFISIITTQSIGKILVTVGSLSPSNTLNSTLSPSVT